GKDAPAVAFLVPLSGLSYAAFLALMLTYAWVGAQYTQLLEKQINYLLGSPLYLFETEYVWPKSTRGREESPTFFILVILITALPIGATAYALKRLSSEISLFSMSPTPTFTVLLGTLGLLVCILSWAIVRVIRNRRSLNEKLLEEWKRSLKDG